MSSLLFWADPNWQVSKDSLLGCFCWGQRCRSALLWQFCWVFLNSCKTLLGGCGRVFLIGVKADALQSRDVTLYSLQKKKRYSGSTNVASELAPANPARVKLDCALCRRHGATAGDAPHSSGWNLPSAWDCRLESGNLQWLVTSEFSLGTNTQLLKHMAVLKIIYWCYLLDFALRAALNIQLSLDY